MILYVNPLVCHPERSEGSEAHNKRKIAVEKIILHRRVKRNHCLLINTTFTFSLINIKPFSIPALPIT